MIFPHSGDLLQKPHSNSSCRSRTFLDCPKIIPLFADRKLGMKDRKSVVGGAVFELPSAHGVSSPFAPTPGFPIMSDMPKSKILIADDNNTNVELLEAYLDGVDCEIAVAVDGLDTLAKVAEFQPDLILLDIMMPKMSGFEVCKTLKRDPNTRQIMILMVTALNELGDIERAVAAGCDDFLSKPVNKLELVKRVENMLKLRHVTDELERLRRYIDSMEDRARRGRRRRLAVM